MQVGKATAQQCGGPGAMGNPHDMGRKSLILAMLAIPVGAIATVTQNSDAPRFALWDEMTGVMIGSPALAFLADLGRSFWERLACSTMLGACGLFVVVFAIEYPIYAQGKLFVGNWREPVLCGLWAATSLAVFIRLPRLGIA